MVGCITLQNPTNRSGCNYINIKSARELFISVKTTLEAEFSKAQNGFEEYEVFFSY